MKKILVLMFFCLVTFSVKAQEDEVDPELPSSNLALEFGTGLSSLVSSSFEIGPKLELSFWDGPFRIGIFGEYSKTKCTSVEVGAGEGLTKIHILNKDVNIFQLGVQGEYFPFDFGANNNPYLWGSSGVLLGNFSSEKTHIALSFGIGTDFFVPISNKLLNPFVKIGYQKITNPIKNLDQNGLKIEIGIKI